MPNRDLIRSAPLKNHEDIKDWTFERNVDDIDIVGVYNEWKEKLDHSTNLKDGFNKEEHLEAIKLQIVDFCNKNDYNYDYHFQNANLLLNSNEEALYVLGLAIKLIYIDKHKIRVYLDYHKLHYPKNRDFVNLMHYKVYDKIVRLSPFQDLDERLPVIMNWIEEISREQNIIKDIQVKRRGNRLGSSKKTTNPKTFEELFRDPAQAQIIIDILKVKEVIDPDGSWVGLSKYPTEIVALIQVLEDKSYLKRISRSTLAPIFRQKFNFKLGDRSFRSKAKIIHQKHGDYSTMIPDLKK